MCNPWILTLSLRSLGGRTTESSKAFGSHMLDATETFSYVDSEGNTAGVLKNSESTDVHRLRSSYFVTGVVGFEP